MHVLDRIEEALASKHLDAYLFERCAVDLLSEVYPGLPPIPGGTDWGRDADVPSNGSEPPVRLLVTTSRSLKGVRQNALAGVRSMLQHGLPFRRLVLANPAKLNQQSRQKLEDDVSEYGATIEIVYDRTLFSSRLRRDGEWRSRLLGLSANPISLSRVPMDLADNPWAELPLMGRERDLEGLSRSSTDVIVTGPPGVGKTRLLATATQGLFVDRDAAPEQLADDIRSLQPRVLIVDDAGNLEQLIRRLVRLRQLSLIWITS